MSKNDVVKCRLCGKGVKSIGSHLRMGHKQTVTKNEYMERFPDAPLFCPSKLAKQAKRKNRRRQIASDGALVKCKLCGESFAVLSAHLHNSHNKSLKAYNEVYPGAPTISKDYQERRTEISKANAGITNKLSDDLQKEINEKRAKATKKQWVKSKAQKKDSLVACQICNAKVTNLGQHLNKLHRMALTLYKQLFKEAPTKTVKQVVADVATKATRIDQLKAKLARVSEKEEDDIPDTVSSDDNHVTCLICNKQFKQLCTHVPRKHGISMDDYRVKFPGAPTIVKRLQKIRQETGRKLLTGRKVSDETRQKLSQAAKKQWADPVKRERVIAAQNVGKLTSEAFRESHAKHLEEVRKTDKFKNSVSEALSKTSKEFWDTEEGRKFQRERLSKLQTERMHAGVNRWVDHRTKRDNYPYELSDGTIIKLLSTWELQVAEDLDSRGITWEYEPGSFPYEFKGATYNYTPDFYLSDYDTYLEVGVAKFKEDPKERAKINSISGLILLTEDNYPFKGPVKANALDTLLG